MIRFEARPQKAGKLRSSRIKAALEEALGRIHAKAPGGGAGAANSYNHELVWSKKMNVDRIDARLLALVQLDNKLSSEELGTRIGLSATAVQRRLRRLRDEGIIQGDVALVSPEILGNSLTLIVLCSLDRERADIIDRFKLAVRAAPEVSSGYFVTGDADFVLVVTARDMQEFERFTRDVCYSNGVRTVKTMVSIDSIKTGHTIPIDPSQFD